MVDIVSTDIQILFIDDNEGYLGVAVNRLKRFNYQHIDTAHNESESFEKLKNKHYDVIVADMRLGDVEAGGFTIVEEIQRLNITSIVIILTANDTVEDCRKALRGYTCWDYISKTMQEKSSLEELHDSIQKALFYSNRWGNRRDEKWIDENWATLKDNYPNKYIAVLNNTVIESADTETVLKQQLNDRKLPLFLPVIKEIKVETVADLIKLGESENLEFKQTYQYETNEKNPKRKSDILRFEVLETIAAFLNTKGGTLLIGVKDNGEIYGVENDFPFLHKDHQDTDGLERSISDSVCDYIGAVFAPFINIHFEKIDEKQVCVIKVKKSHEYAFLKNGDKKTFFIRTNNGAKSLDTEAFYAYALTNLKKNFE